MYSTSVLNYYSIIRDYNVDDVRDRDGDSIEDSSPPATPQPTKRVTRSRGKGEYIFFHYNTTNSICF